MPTTIDTVAPAKTYGKGDALYVQAQQIWIILTAFVMSKSFPGTSWEKFDHPNDRIYYSELAAKMGRPGAQRTLSRQLEIVGRYCVMNNLPALNAIVVNKTSQIPGDGVVLHQSRDEFQEIATVNNFDWFTVRPPTVGALRKVYDWINASH
ncbi:hypothetical protein OE699_12280 [Sedimentimonas flavescens]|uniref:Uncharacterized protein n=1 Tax=Sedimentimonas flavescens TaxID=2851012 RepID=A0ABT3A1M4_9RHOB|nr:hypothetical protein [Sedimentimonas flavescens]MCV2879624.1 hypothetical protein [Sedimentimonas flavescens]